MALLAPSSEGAVVNIVALVARIANCSNNFDQRQAVAIGASGLPMGAIEREFGRPVVVKRPHGPGSRDVAVSALFTECAFVHVVLAMTTHARCWRLPVPRRHVAILASGRTMATGQWKPGAVMVEARFLPVGIAMAARAVVAEFALVHIFALMT